jgi:putative membrane protein
MKRTWISAGILVMAIAASPAGAQNTAAGSGGQNTTPSGGQGTASSGGQSPTSSGGQSTTQSGSRQGSGSSGTTDRQSSGTTGAQAKSGADRQFVEKMLMANMAEVELGRMASTKASSAEVKSYAEMMVSDHTKANEQLMPIAQSLGITAPTQLDAKHRAVADRLSKLEGAQFDKQFMAAMVQSHREALNDTRRASGSANNTRAAGTASNSAGANATGASGTASSASGSAGSNAVGTSGSASGSSQSASAYAAQTAPTIEQHLQKAQQLQKSVASQGSAGKSGSSGGASAK